MGKRWLAGLLSAALCLCLLCPAPTRAADICFTAIDESVLKLTRESMPIWSDGVLYAPYTTFDEGDNSLLDWNIQTSYSKANNKVTVFDTSRFLCFDLKTGTCWDDLTGVAYTGGAILRGDRPYLPVEIVCRHFGLSYSYRELAQGDLLRIKTGDAVIPDSRFPDAAENILAHRLKEYNQSQGTSGTSGSAQRPDGEKPNNGQSSVSTYLGLRCGETQYVEHALTLLESRGQPAMFFVNSRLVEQRTDLVMRILGSGSSIGLQAWGESVEECRALLEQGNAALGQQAFFRTTVALVPQQFREELEKEGWVCWDSTLELDPTPTTGANYFSGRVISQLGERSTAVCLSMDLDADAMRVLLTLLLRLEEAGFGIELPLETLL